MRVRQVHTGISKMLISVAVENTHPSLTVHIHALDLVRDVFASTGARAAVDYKVNLCLYYLSAHYTCVRLRLQ